MSYWARTSFAVRERHWGEETALFHCGSAETLLMDAGTALIFSLLDAIPQPEADICRKVALQSDLTSDEVSDYVMNALVRLASLELAVKLES